MSIRLLELVIVETFKILRVSRASGAVIVLTLREDVKSCWKVLVLTISDIWIPFTEDTVKELIDPYKEDIETV
jgi:hypothetical protein